MLSSTFQIDCDGTLALSYHIYGRNYLLTHSATSTTSTLEEVLLPERFVDITINGFYTSALSEATFIVLSALATLPCLEFVKLRRDVSEGSHFERPEALKNLMLSPSLRVHFESYFLDPLSGIGRPSRTINVAWLCFDCCSIPDAGHQIASSQPEHR
jgi:hypothetical protein